MPTELNLISAAKAGNLAAFEQLVLAYERRLFSYLQRLLASKEDAEDVAQETFLRAFKNLAAFDEAQSFKTWIFSIATNAAYDVLRRRTRRGEKLLIDDPENSFETIDDTPAYYSIEVKADVAQALDGLKPEFRAVLLLFYWQELSVEQIAQMLGKPAGTVKTYLFRGRQAVKMHLQETYGSNIASNQRDQ